MWAVDVAEIANHARSVLDQLIWQLVLANGGDPTRSHTQFPIATDFERYAKGRSPPRERQLSGVARKHRRLVDEYQPYQAGAQARQHPLYVLNEVVKREKHRAGHVVLGTATVCRARLILPNGEDVILSYKRGMPLGHDVDMLALENQPDPLAPGIHASLELIEFALDVGFQSDENVVLLDDIERGVLMASQIVARCSAKL